MAYDWYFDRSENCLFFQHSGQIQFGEPIASLEVALREQEYSQGLNILRDISQATLPDTFDDPQFAIGFREKLQNLFQNRKEAQFAWVVGDAQQFAVIHRWAARLRFSKDFEISPFRELDDAREWLGLPADYEIKYPKLAEQSGLHSQLRIS